MKKPNLKQPKEKASPVWRVGFIFEGRKVIHAATLGECLR